MFRLFIRKCCYTLSSKYFHSRRVLILYLARKQDYSPRLEVLNWFVGGTPTLGSEEMIYIHTRCLHTALQEASAISFHPAVFHSSLPASHHNNVPLNSNSSTRRKDYSPSRQESPYSNPLVSQFSALFFVTYPVCFDNKQNSDG